MLETNHKFRTTHSATSDGSNTADGRLIADKGTLLSKRSKLGVDEEVVNSVAGLAGTDVGFNMSQRVDSAQEFCDLEYIRMT